MVVKGRACMKFYKMRFAAKKDNFDQDIKLVDDYLGCLYKNGQIVKYESIFIKDNSVFCCITLPEDSAISGIKSNEYVIKSREEVDQIFKVSLETMGENWYFDGKVCECELPSYYVLICNALIGNLVYTESPITCGDCGSPMPLYKLPKIFGEKDYYTVREFEREYQSVEQLWISCLDDKFTFKQRNSRFSPLVKKGRKICKAFEKATGIKFYYYIPLDDDAVSKCPFCGKDWGTRDNYKCDDCRLVAHKK
jgi:predicted  nucleic acid-binding Zn ribbon protein